MSGNQKVTSGGATSSPQISAPIHKRQAPNPRITINIPPSHYAMPSPYQMHSTHSHPSNPTTAAGGGIGMPPPHWPPYANPFNEMYNGGAGKFMFRQFEGFKDFTFASAKSGLNLGEKSAFYIYEKFSKWSRQWFTHCFLFLVIFLYSLAGASIFVYVEGPPQQQAIDDIRQLKFNFSKQLHTFAKDKKMQDNFDEWQGAVDKEMQGFVKSLQTIFKSGYFDQDQKVKPPVWSFWNAMFYCGTIYTTIGYAISI